MTNTIWKFEIPMVDEFEIAMPEGAQILHVAAQNGTGCIWVRVNPDNPTKYRAFMQRGTGHEVDADSSYLGSFQLSGGKFVFHLFEPVKQ